jgi:hypothetical protein
VSMPSSAEKRTLRRLRQSNVRRRNARMPPSSTFSRSTLTMLDRPSLSAMLMRWMTSRKESSLENKSVYKNRIRLPYQFFLVNSYKIIISSNFKFLTSIHIWKDMGNEFMTTSKKYNALYMKCILHKLSKHY